MITLHNLQGQALAVNGSLIERLDGGHETHITMSNGTSYVVKEPLEEVVRLHREDRAIVQVIALEIANRSEAEPPGTEGGARDGLLRLVTPTNEDGGVPT
jgi:flagellar protein FlbD